MHMPFGCQTRISQNSDNFVGFARFSGLSGLTGRKKIVGHHTGCDYNPHRFLNPLRSQQLEVSSSDCKAAPLSRCKEHPASSYFCLSAIHTSAFPFRSIQSAHNCLTGLFKLFGKVMETRINVG